MRSGRSNDGRLILLLVGAVLLVGCGGKGKRQLEVLRQFATDMPRYKDFTQVNSFEQHSPGTALLVLCYNSAAGLDDVVAFYSGAMAERNWAVFSKEERKHTILYPDDLAFRKGDYLIGIKKAQSHEKDCRYLVTYYWSEF